MEYHCRRSARFGRNVDQRGPRQIAASTAGPPTNRTPSAFIPAHPMTGNHAADDRSMIAGSSSPAGENPKETIALEREKLRVERLKSWTSVLTTVITVLIGTLA